MTHVPSVGDHRQVAHLADGHAARVKRADGHHGAPRCLPMIDGHDLWAPARSRIGYWLARRSRPSIQSNPKGTHADPVYQAGPAQR